MIFQKCILIYFFSAFLLTDLLVGLVNVLIDILQRITITWHAGNLGCKLIRYLQVLINHFAISVSRSSSERKSLQKYRKDV